MFILEIEGKNFYKKLNFETFEERAEYINKHWRGDLYFWCSYGENGVGFEVSDFPYFITV